jgi:hypothetical protein
MEDTTRQSQRFPYFKISLIILLLVLVCFYTMRTYSFCVAERRFLSKDEIVDAAIDIELEALGRGLLNGGYKPILVSRDTFKRLHPDCCRILASGDNMPLGEIGWLDTLFGYYSSAVELKYQMLIVDEDGKGKIRSMNAVASVIVGACGEHNMLKYGRRNVDIAKEEVNQ